MRNSKRNFLIIAAAFLFLSSFLTFAQDLTTSNQAKTGINSDNSTITGNQNTNCLSRKDIEEIVERAHERNHKNSDQILINAQWLVTMVIALIGFLFSLLGYLSYRYVATKAEIEIESIKRKSDEAINDLNSKLTEAKDDLSSKLAEVNNNLNNSIANVAKEFNKKIKCFHADAYYDLAIRSKEKRIYDLALDLLLVLYKSNYRLRDVCYHIGFCYKNNEEPDYSSALKFFGEGKDLALKSGKEAMANTIQREIDETIALMQAAPSS